MDSKIKIILFTFLLFPLSSLAFECSITNLDGKSDAELEAISLQCEKEALEQKILLDAKQRESVTIERDISIIDNKIYKTDLDIRATKVKIYQIGQEIDQKEVDIRTLSEKTEEIIEHLAVLIKRSNELDASSYLEALLSRKSLSSFFIDIDDFGEVKKGLDDKLNELRGIKKDTETAKTQLEESEMNERGLKLKTENEKKKAEVYKDEKYHKIVNQAGSYKYWKKAVKGVSRRLKLSKI